MELGAAVTTGTGDVVEVEVPTEQLDIDQGYDEALSNLRERKPTMACNGPDVEVLKEDYYREIRTRLVLVWFIANATLAMAMTEVFDVNSGQNGYLTCKCPFAHPNSSPGVNSSSSSIPFDWKLRLPNRRHISTWSSTTFMAKYGSTTG